MKNTQITKKREKTSENTRRVICLRCSYTWFYGGKLAHRQPRVKNRCRCPRCHSSQNNFNRKIFGGFLGL